MKLFPVSGFQFKVAPQAGINDALGKIQAIYKKHDPDNPFEYRFCDQEYAKKFGNEERIGKLAGFFTLLAIFISCLGLFGLANWLQDYTYRTNISWWVFVIAGISALGVTLLTISYQAIKAALMNPVKSLRTE